MQFNFIGPSFQAASLNQNAQTCYNLFPERDESGTAKNKMMLQGTPGLALVATLPTSPVRGMLSGGSAALSASRLFVVSGTKLYEVTAVGTIVGGTNRGDVGTDAANSPVQIFANGTQLMIVSAGKVFIDNGGAANGANAQPAQYQPVTYNGTVFTNNSATPSTGDMVVTWASGDVFTPLMLGRTMTINAVAYVVDAFYNSNVVTVTTAAGVFNSSPVAYTTTTPGANVLGTTGGFLDTYYLAQTPQSNQFQFSGVNDRDKDGTSHWNPLDFAVKEAGPDHIVSMLVDHQEIWLFGDNTTEVWRDAGTANTPFVRFDGGCIQQGCAAPWSAVSLNNGVAWIGGDNLGNAAAWYAVGFQPVRISTHAIEAIWADYTLSDATAFVYEDAGHVFWQISFPTSNATWVYDATEQLWHQRGSNLAGTEGRHIANCHAFAFGGHYVGDYQSGRLLLMSRHLFTDAGRAITRIRSAPHISTENHWTFHSRFRLDAENTGALNPTLSWSNDGGANFINPQTTVSNTAGALASYEYRRLGKARDRVYQITITAAVKVALINAYLDAKAGTT